MKTKTTEIEPGLDEVRTDPEGRFWLWVDRRTPEHRVTLRTKTMYPNTEVASFNPYAMANTPGLEIAILCKLNATA